MASRLEPNRTCWCGCGGETRPDSFFVRGHDSKAESAILDLEYGGRPELLNRHGYGPSGQNLLQALRRKYRPLADYLAAQSADQVTLNFLEIENILGSPLPRSALENSRWWSNQREYTPSEVWLDAGWRSGPVSMRHATVTFTREGLRNR